MTPHAPGLGAITTKEVILTGNGGLNFVLFVDTLPDGSSALVIAADQRGKRVIIGTFNARDANPLIPVPTNRARTQK